MSKPIDSKDSKAKDVKQDKKQTTETVETLPRKLYYTGNWKSNAKDYEGTVQVVHNRDKRRAKVYFIVNRGAAIPRLMLPYRKVLKMYEQGKDQKKDSLEFPKLSGSVLGHDVSFTLDPACTLFSQKMSGNFRTRGKLLDDDGRFTVTRIEGMDKSFKETAGCSIM
jgi:hypothetical protein